jgi:hypothetical protein
MITRNLINKTAQRLYKNIKTIDVFLENNKFSISLEEYKELIRIREDKKYFIVFLESSVTENQLDSMRFERDIMPIINVCESIEELLS